MLMKNLSVGYYNFACLILPFNSVCIGITMKIFILAHPNYNIPYPSNGVGPFSGPETAPPMYEQQQPQQVDIEDIPVMFSDDDYSKYYTPPHIVRTKITNGHLRSLGPTFFFRKKNKPNMHSYMQVKSTDFLH